MEDAAQSFLNKKLKAIGMDTSDPNNPYSYGEGIVPSGPGYEDQRIGGSATKTPAVDAYAAMEGGSDTERNYREGNWGSGELDAEALAEKFGLDRSKEGKGEGHIWGTKRDGSQVYIGKSDESHLSNQELIDAHSGQSNSKEVDHSSVPESLSSSGDVKGAVLTMFDGGEGTKETGGEEEGEIPPIEHSPQIQQAKQRVQDYETRHLSGEASESIFGNTRPSDEYTFDANRGMEGIGTSPVSASQHSAEKAAASFLDNKRFDIKNTLNSNKQMMNKKFEYSKLR